MSDTDSNETQSVNVWKDRGKVRKLRKLSRRSFSLLDGPAPFDYTMNAVGPPANKYGKKEGDSMLCSPTIICKQKDQMPLKDCGNQPKIHLSTSSKHDKKKNSTSEKCNLATKCTVRNLSDTRAMSASSKPVETYGSQEVTPTNGMVPDRISSRTALQLESVLPKTTMQPDDPRSADEECRNVEDAPQYSDLTSGKDESSNCLAQIGTEISETAVSGYISDAYAKVHTWHYSPSIDSEVIYVPDSQEEMERALTVKERVQSHNSKQRSIRPPLPSSDSDSSLSTLNQGNDKRRKPRQQAPRARPKIMPKLVDYSSSDEDISPPSSSKILDMKTDKRNIEGSGHIDVHTSSDEQKSEGDTSTDKDATLPSMCKGTTSTASSGAVPSTLKAPDKSSDENVKVLDASTGETAVGVPRGFSQWGYYKFIAPQSGNDDNGGASADPGMDSHTGAGDAQRRRQHGYYKFIAPQSGKNINDDNGGASADPGMDSHTGAGDAQRRRQENEAQNQPIISKIDEPALRYSSFSDIERKNILAYIIKEKAYDKVKGTALYMGMVSNGVCPGRTWKSLKEQFLKTIMPLYIKKYVNAEELAKFTRGLASYGKSKQRGKLKLYTPIEDKALIKYMLRGNRYKCVGGTNVWKVLEQTNLLPDRSWQSMRDHFRKVLVSKLEDYDVTLAEAEAIRHHCPF